MNLNSTKVVPVVGVTDMAKAKDFYEGKLGLSDGEEQADGGIEYPTGGGTKLHVYPSPSVSPSGATLAFFETDDVEGTVDELTANGVSFEQYDMEGLKTNEKGIAELGDNRGAWFKDPDGNILAIGDM